MRSFVFVCVLSSAALASKMLIRLNLMSVYTSTIIFSSMKRSTFTVNLAVLIKLWEEKLSIISIFHCQIKSYKAFVAATTITTKEENEKEEIGRKKLAHTSHGLVHKCRNWILSYL